MKDPEFIELKNRFLLSLLAIVIFAAALLVFMFRMLKSTDSVYRKAVKGETMYVLIVSKKCSRCGDVKEVLHDEKINYYTIDENNNIIDGLYTRIGLDDKVTSPCLLYIKKGKLDSYIDNIKYEDELIEFINK